MKDSIHEKLKRVRKPRVHITYDLETNGSIEAKELPFVMGVMGDYSGDNVDEKKPMKERKFSQVDADNFSELMTRISPRLNLQVDNALSDDDTRMSVSLEFKTMEDFEPHKLVEQVEPLRHLLDTRNRLRDLLTKADRSDDLEKILEDILKNTDALANFSAQLDAPEATGV